MNALLKHYPCVEVNKQMGACCYVARTQVQLTCWCRTALCDLWLCSRCFSLLNLELVLL